MRSPLTSVVGYAELLLRADSSPFQKTAVDIIRSEGLRMATLVDDLLDVSRLHAEVGLDPSLASAIVLADAPKLLQVFTNLLSNAIKYSPAGPRIELSAHPKPPNRWVLTVTDHGLGIPVLEQAHLFRLFQRIHTCETEGIPGTGVGLCVVKTIVERLQGEVWVESEPGRGSTFFVSLRAAPK